MRARIWVVAAGAAVAIAGVSGVAVAASGPSTKPATPARAADVRPRALGERDFFDASVTGVLVARLGVSDATARSVVDRLRTLAARGGGSLSPADPAFIAIARGAGVTPGRLAAALDDAKKGASK